MAYWLESSNLIRREHLALKAKPFLGSHPTSCQVCLMPGEETCRTALVNKSNRVEVSALSAEHCAVGTKQSPDQKSTVDKVSEWHEGVLLPAINLQVSCWQEEIP